MALFSNERVQATSPAAPSANGTVLGTFKGLDEYDDFAITATLTGATGGVLDIFLQRLITLSDGTKLWADWAHFAQVAAGASAVVLSCNSTAGDTTIRTIGVSADTPAAPPVLAANTFCGGHPGDQVRVLAVAGAGTSAGAQQTIDMTCRASSKRYG